MSGFNPWYVGGGVKRMSPQNWHSYFAGFNPWYVGGGVKSLQFACQLLYLFSFNPWYVGGGVKRISQSLPTVQIQKVSILGMLEGVLKV